MTRPPAAKISSEDRSATSRAPLLRSVTSGQYPSTGPRGWQSPPFRPTPTLPSTVRNTGRPTPGEPPRVTVSRGNARVDTIEIEWQFDALDLRPAGRWLASLSAGSTSIGGLGPL